MRRVDADKPHTEMLEGSNAGGIRSFLPRSVLCAD